MIYVKKLYGGMCNTLLQFSNCLTFLKYLNIPYENLKIRFIKDRYKDIDINYLINEFILNFEYKSDPPDVPQFLFDRKKFLELKKCNFNLIINDCILQACFFGDIKLLYNFLNIRNKQDDIIKKYSFDTKNSSLIHIRRTDFFKYRNGKYILSDETIFNIINKLYPTRNIFICTDDVVYVKKILRDFKYIKYISDICDNTQDEFLLSSTCENIIKNPGSTWSILLDEFSKIYHNVDFKSLFFI